MQLISEALERTIEELAKLPGMGRKSAQRIAMHLLKKDDGEVFKLAEALVHLKKSTTTCAVCQIVSDRDPCPVCANPKRNTCQVCVVEDVKSGKLITSCSFPLISILCNPTKRPTP